MINRTPVTLARDESILRPAGTGDVDAISALWHEGWIDGHLGHVPDVLLRHRHRSSFRARVPYRLGRTTVAANGSTVLGFVTVHEDEIEQLYVAAPARSSGVADLLLRHGEGEIAAHHPLAWLAVVAGNARARRFYERNGWTDAGAFDYFAEASADRARSGAADGTTRDGGTVAVPSRRYEKDVTG